MTGVSLVHLYQPGLVNNMDREAVDHLCLKNQDLICIPPLLSLTHRLAMKPQAEYRKLSQVWFTLTYSLSYRSFLLNSFSITFT